MKYSVETLLNSIESGTQVKFLFFWGHQPLKNGAIGKSCFSQWWISPFLVDGIEYQSTEHWMMAGKAKLFGDDEILDKILAVNSPAEAKKLGRQVRGWDQQKWEEHRFEIVVEGNLHKFSQHDDLKEFLLNTHSRVLVEASPPDRIWGIGMKEGDDHIENPSHWKGLNLLGFALMEVRDRLSN